MDKEKGKEYILSLSYGKDSMACIEAIFRLGYPLDRIVTADLWFTDDISADYPEVRDFKEHADCVIYERYGIKVQHVCARNKDGSKHTYKDLFYTRVPGTDKYKGWTRYGIGCQASSDLKRNALTNANIGIRNGCGIWYMGIAADEQKRIQRHAKRGFILPLVDIGWSESDCMKWCEENNLLSPIYLGGAVRDGCWFCHNQRIEYLRNLRHNYNDLWSILLEWDEYSSGIFRGDGHSISDFERRFAAEDLGAVPSDGKFRWSQLDSV